MISINKNQGTRTMGAPQRLAIKSLCLSTLLLVGLQVPLLAQEAPFAKPSLWIGGAAGANINFYNGSTQNLTQSFKPPVAFHEGVGAGLYLAPLVEYRRPESKWGLMLQTGYDSRRASFAEQITPCDCPVNLATNLAYITVEPSLRFSPFKSGFYLMGGPQVAFNVKKSYTYQLETNPALVDQVKADEMTGEFDNVKSTLLSMQVGAGYDIPLVSQQNRTQMTLSPFVAYHPYFGQSPRTVDTWNINTLRVGAALKFGRGKANVAPIPPVAKVDFTVNSPANVPGERRVSESFPLRNYVFFDLGFTEIPARYVQLTKEQVKNFKEDQLDATASATSAGRSNREMQVYYNILNILGDRMDKHPSSSITLVGSSEKGPQDGRTMAEAVKSYLVSTFGIGASRIAIEGRDKPKIPSEQPGGTKELELLREGDRRVSIESNSPALLMEFQSGPTAPLKPVTITTTPEAPRASYVTFNAAGAGEAFTTWRLELVDESGKVQNFGPYTEEAVSLPGKSILGTRPQGTYLVKMIGTTESGETVTREMPATVVLWTPAKDEESKRFSVIYEFNDAKAIPTYEKYLTDVVAPKIPNGGKVIIQGHTDVIGEESSNQQLSLARANNVKAILENSLAKAGRSDVTFEVSGLGEAAAPFGNSKPEERAYNRTVIIDIIPVK